MNLQGFFDLLLNMLFDIMFCRCTLAQVFGDICTFMKIRFAFSLHAITLTHLNVRLVNNFDLYMSARL